MDNGMMFPDGRNLDNSANAGFDSTSLGDQALPGAPVAAVPTPQAFAPQTKKPNKTLFIIGLILAVLVVTIGIVAVVVACLANNDIGSAEIIDEDTATSDEDLALTAFKNLTKEEAMAFLRSRKNDAYGVLPEGYVGKEITDAVIVSGRNTVVSNLTLIYSYDDMAELRQMACERYNVFSADTACSDGVDAEDDFEITEYDYYAIVTPNRIKEGATACDAGYNSDCNSLFSFKRSYLNHFLEETSPHSYNDVFYLNARDPEVVNELLRTFTFFVYYGSIYSYSFEEQEDRFVLTVNYVGAGINAEMLKDFNSYGSDISEMYAINLYTRRYAADKADGHIYGIPVQTEPEVSYSDYVRSFPITKAEMTSLLGYGL